jgi:hypothetical protein
MKKILFVSLIALSATTLQASETIYPGEVLGRDLLLPGASWVGHVGISMASYIKDPAYNVVEVMNEKVVVQRNTISGFKMKSPYWGSRWGANEKFGDTRYTKDSRLLTALREANRQRLGCHTYSYTADYRPAVINSDGTKGRCGTFRCDTFMNYVNYFGKIYLPTHNAASIPLLVWKAYPHSNGDFSPGYVAHESDQMKLAVAPDISTLQGYIEKYKKTGDLQDLIKTQEIYQDNDVKSFVKDNGLKNFYKEVMKSASTSQELEIAIRGFSSLSSNDEIIENQDYIRSSLDNVHPHIRTGMYTDLVFRGQSLANIFKDDLISSLEIASEDTKEVFSMQLNYRIKNMGRDNISELFSSYLIEYDEDSAYSI